MAMRVDTSDLDRLVVELSKAESRALPEVQKVVSKGALNIKKDVQRRWSGLAHAPALPAAVSYDVTNKLRSIEAEIGPDLDKRQGPIGGLLERGTIKNAPIPALAPALEAEDPRFVKALEDVAVKVLP